MARVALSTMWGIGKFPRVDQFIEAARVMGFTRFELNHAIDSAMLQGLDLNGYRVTSVHEPCPADIPVPKLRKRNWLISSTDEAGRCEGVRAVKRSIDLAHALGATVIIVHPGQVDIDRAPESTLRHLYKQGQAQTTEYARVKEQLISARAAQAPANLGAVRRSLAELAEYANRFNIRLGLENRYHYHEIPLPDELEELLDAGLRETVGFWYDVGHAQALDRMGLYPHEEWLRRFSSRMVGTHLHDVIGLQDHQAAGQGEVDWPMVQRYLPDTALRTCEFQNSNSPEQVSTGVQWLIDQGCVQAD